ncbi:MAG: glycosyl transferase group 1 [Friedmanniella sp.]|nr:glycosyl transferase group 1 [Friedmanniella sp.]
MSMSYGVLSTYPPTQCGLASFSRALVAAISSPANRVGVVRVMDPGESPAPVDHTWVRGTPRGAESAAAALNSYDVAVIQHEYGIFPGHDGDEILPLVRALRVPTIVVLHTVLVTPSEHQREILEELARNSSVLVTMTETARQRLLAHYEVDAGQVQVIPHGAEPSPLVDAAPAPEVAGRGPVVLTWGLLGEGKGIEWAIDAMATLSDLDPRPEYWVVGQTHPKVKAVRGEVYREMLVEHTGAGWDGMVVFEDRYIDKAELHRIVQQADIVLLPYDSREQVTSGVLIEAVTAGKPVVSTRFPHAVELLSSGAGLLVDRQDPAGIAAALRRIMTEPGLARSMAREANRIAPDLLWPAVADRYRQVAGAIRQPAAALASA